MTDDIASLTADRIREETDRFVGRDSTPSELMAAEILHRCYRYHSTSDPAEAFSLVPKFPGRKRPGAPWTAGDLASGATGAEFIYAYLPIRFVERLLDEANRAGVPTFIADTLVSGATVYFLNNLRQVLDEAMVSLAYEASVVFNAIGSAAMNMENKNSLTYSREKFAEIIDTIISEGNTRRKERVRQAMWEIDPRLTLASLYSYYQKVYPSWKKAAQIYRKNADLTTWEKIIQDEVSQTDGINLPENLIYLLSPKAESPNASGTLECTPSGLALEHAARACGVDDFRYSTGYLRAIITTQKQSSEKSAQENGFS